MAGGMIVVPNEENFCPKIRVESMLSLNNREIIAGRDNAAVQNDQVGVPGRKNYCLLRAAAEGDAGQQDGGVIKEFTEEAIIHGSEIECAYGIYNCYSTTSFAM